MSKAIAKLSPTAASLVAALESASSAIRNSSGDMPFLRLLKSGEWVHGGDDNDVENGSLWAVDPNSFSMGFQAWGSDADLLGEEVRLVTEQPLLRSELKEVGGEWKPLMGCTFVCISGMDEGLQVSYKVTSKGGIKALGKLMQELVSRIKTNPEDGSYVPVIELGVDHYKHKTYGRIYTPLFDIKDWSTEEALSGGEYEDEAEEAEPEPEPKKPARKRASKKAEPEVEEAEFEEVEEEDEPEEKPAPRRRKRRAV